MISFAGKLILLDIEGTVSPLAFVHDVMFPYARKHAAAWLGAHWGHEVIAQLARDAGAFSFHNALDAEAAVHRLMDADAKVTGLKQLQGLIWEQGFKSGDLCATLFADVASGLQRFKDAGLELRIYSSGSTHAQRLFFAHTELGDLTVLLSGYYDTTLGPKREAASYAAITADAGVPAGEILFLSDVVAELDAASTAGMRTGLALRPGNPPVPPNSHPAFSMLDEIVLTP
jgi:enolase-phosphatase E1